MGRIIPRERGQIRRGKALRRVGVQLFYGRDLIGHLAPCGAPQNPDCGQIDQRPGGDAKDHHRQKQPTVDQRAQPSKIGTGLAPIEIQRAKRKLEGDEHLDQKTDNAPESGGDDARPDHAVHTPGRIHDGFASPIWRNCQMHLPPTNMISAAYTM
ncbi:hypothetical protein [uncultured Tateyamaria sp.]|uniref:hypothetical protein n=1 Tax=uncultured Tateyamaria sp. TaxID=455651 RepID=UPI002608E732|nr:hypothetical protein [uncultured Tateyamaria sp.]